MVCKSRVSYRVVPLVACLRVHCCLFWVRVCCCSCSCCCCSCCFSQYLTAIVSPVVGCVCVCVLQIRHTKPTEGWRESCISTGKPRFRQHASGGSASPNVSRNLCGVIVRASNGCANNPAQRFSHVCGARFSGVFAWKARYKTVCVGSVSPPPECSLCKSCQCTCIPQLLKQVHFKMRGVSVSRLDLARGSWVYVCYLFLQSKNKNREELSPGAQEFADHYRYKEAEVCMICRMSNK